MEEADPQKTADADRNIPGEPARSGEGVSEPSDSPGPTETAPPSDVEGDAVPAAPIRTGSPFAAVPERSIPEYTSEAEGVWKETARGATVASIVVLLFGIVALTVFPEGAIAIAALGVATACMGLASAWWHVGTVALLLNAFVCGAAFLQTI